MTNIYSHLAGSINGGTPQWMVYNGKFQSKMDDDWPFRKPRYNCTSTHEGVTARMKMSWRKSGIEAAKICKDWASIFCSAMWDSGIDYCWGFHYYVG